VCVCDCVYICDCANINKCVCVCAYACVFASLMECTHTRGNVMMLGQRERGTDVLCECPEIIGI
jgi:hypothetical protein